MDNNNKLLPFPLFSAPENVLKKIIKSMELLDLNQFSLVSKKTKSLADMKSVQFPLLSMPRNALNDVIQNLSLLSLFKFSAISKTTKSFSKVIDWKPMPIDVMVKDVLAIYADCKHFFYEIAKDENPIKRSEDEKPRFNPEPEVKDALAYTFHLTKQKTIRSLVFREGLDEAVLPIAFYDFPVCENITIDPNVPDCAQRKILAKYKDSMKQLRLYSNPPAELKKAIVAQNFDCLRDQHLDKSWMNLDDLLIANSAALSVYRMDLKILNKFLKVWIRKKCNPRLEYLWTDRLDADFDMKMVLAGINYKEVPEDTIRTFKHSGKVIKGKDWLTTTDTMEVQGGYDFKRRDGALATITVREKSGKRKLEFTVWPYV